MKGTSVVQLWVSQLSFMQQSVLFAAIRGPDGIHKDHVSKALLRWYRRCVLYCAFCSTKQGKPFIHEAASEGCVGSFTGALKAGSIDDVVNEYIRSLDELPHHFQLHFMHAAEILAYKHDEDWVAEWWWRFYRKLCMDMHLEVEPESAMDKRLGDDPEGWRAREAVTANPGARPT